MLSHELYRKVDHFVKTKGENDIKAWRILQSIVHTTEPSDLRLIGRNTWFFRCAIGLTMRTSRSFLVTEPGVEVPKPSDILHVIPVFQMDIADLWARVLWQLACDTYELSGSDLVVQKDVAVEELMLLWNMAFAARLRRQPSVTGQLPESTSRLDWSFLPNPETLSTALRHDDSDSPRVSLERALAMSLPAVLHDRISARSGFPDIFYDFASAALVTVDLLHQTFRLMGDSPAGDTALRRYAPFVNFIDDIKKVALQPSVPGALRQKLETPDIGENYMSVVERHRLLYVANRDTAERPANHAVITGTEEREATVVFAQNSGADGGPDAALAGVAVKSNPVQDALLEHQRETDVQPPLSTVQAQPIVLPETVGENEPVPLSPFDRPPQKSRDEVTDRFVNVRMTRLGQAMEKQNGAQAEHIKAEVFDFALSPEKPPLPNQLYEHLMLALLTLRKPQSAIEVWNHFVQSGRQPTAKTYTVMMRGAQQVRDINGSEGFWQKMRAAGVQPDIHAWTTRIFGLIRGGKVDFGLRALSEMGQEWINAARAQQAAGAPKKQGGRKQTKVEEMAPAEAAKMFEGDVAGVPRPNLVLMNAAVSGLASRDDQHIPKVLAWGRMFGIEPDGTTYNVLLNITMRHGQAAEAVAILKRMAERGIQADSTTWTVLLSAFFEGKVLDELSPEQQQDRVMGFIRGLEAATTSAIDQKGYALVIDRLLKAYDNPPAASAVLAHMTEQGLQPTTHIYTILMSSYFQRQPPDFAAAEALWNQIQAADGGRGATVDALFYDRMIEAYATHHWSVGTQPLLSFLQRMTDSGQRPSWRALHHAARALYERGDWNHLTQIVDQAREWVKRDGNGQYMLVGERSYGQRDFWSFVIETGLLREEGVERPEQLMRQKTGQSPLTRRMGGMA